MKKLILLTTILITHQISIGQQTIDDNIVIENQNVPYPGMTIFSHHGNNVNGNAHPVINFKSSDGFMGSELAIGKNRILGSIIFSGFDGTTPHFYYQASRIEVVTKDTFNSINHKSQMNFRIGGVNTGITRMSIDGETGNIGIGTINPTEKLSVRGKILCQEVEVIQNVAPDYVFQKYYNGFSLLKEDYKMPTLEEVEAFIKEYYHLPEIPSASEIKKEGMQLKEMTTLLLQKIEELTLYTIEQEKRIKALEAQLIKRQ
ncbi:hypothetical protein [Psychroserpens sp. SPM9]|uniref:hypothetical protein n=1 Tax=Psychroserpens sp. SPM9 TaxID=2975598 RepID=UPI0021A67E76|nr:hypothetical protein [Psychroserpens sp. SPM9]MDG5492970.1 hypothetical protein [Psychroserpens sp. SPM9]